MLALGLLSVAGAASPIATAWTGKAVIDELVRGPNADDRAALAWAVAGAVAAALTAAAAHLSMYASRVIEHRVGAAVEDRLCARVNDFVGLARFEDPAFGNQLHLAQRAAAEAPAALLPTMFELARAGLRTAGFVGSLAVLWPPMAAILVAAAVPELLARLRLAAREARAANAMAHAERRRAFYRYLISDLRAAKEIRVFGLGKLVHARMVATRQAWTTVDLRLARQDVASQSRYAWISAAVLAAASAIAIVRVTRGQASVGDFGLFLAAVAGIQSSLSEVSFQLGTTTGSLRLFSNYLDVVESPVDLETGARPVNPLHTGLELRNVWFRYGRDSPWVLRGVSLSIAAGQTVGVVGLNGAGKSTLVRLLCRFYDPQRGQILWNGQDIRDLDTTAFRRQIAAVFQDYMTYDLTVAENIGIGDVARLGDSAGIADAARRAQVDDAIQRLPGGYRTMLSRVFFDDDDDLGTALSGGQLQRLALARAFMRRDAGLLILDEPAAGQDARAEEAMRQALRTRRRDQITIVISHRLGLVRDTDQIVVLVDGSIQEYGPHHTLIARQGEYARLLALQSVNDGDRVVAS